ncbi:2-oxoacid:acceptor oxidoreductase subunit alpha [Candidatus Roizmanbacteria bacterium CG02_land_8_20_14_3_00_36_15]|uniref:2-oxoacid:acceptor oxidoreductase subunit alpha n=2 Tax=Candidatus Roizmaniibacteriota TaxID=1752723 RepID=A0A2M8KJT5_9BACT|nr:MAG: 2-oxoacid:acceptor oxidoreductase subunit alpha [Candidatus Roizmanbacteria bacterium CG03_land_8_20_14_0_80_36_21]PIV38173.1 MAG: 2-oxoacid:acceptor oxidoreductase subunit alpha [Candidatus Roizmanbacteria bacterium CG02_land_8_20_14_3_00_36_15]PIY69592.1 MAG: 2-oxoacid:acceptor oxidoreductase subunit alpha [Candidatus Roizmanbacteria bacterium CG_4_10_14_0_8_um_filter_36_36]PJA53686.1 MAG: 2-oxoacid:acceptor oxidoreductase subunit alpha [Candidatus Roizmanbacteria bacterium CG_4_9_14_3
MADKKFVFLNFFYGLYRLNMNFTWKIGGEAGFGIMTTGLVFSKIASRSGFHIFDYVEYPSLIRGGHNAYEVHVADFEVTHLKPIVDILICLNKETFEKHSSNLNKDSFVIYDKKEFKLEGDYKKIDVPFKKILAELKGQGVMKNTIALGASLAIIGGEINELLKIITEQFEKKGEEIISFNKKFAEAGFNYAKSNYKKFLTNWLTKKNPKGSLVMTGNDAFSLGSIIADCRLYCAYPMTPSSSVLSTLAAWQDKTGMVVRHAEDEISVINTALGSSFAGARSAVGTSGGGFALMVESISLAGITETPIVIFIAQRPGPATGMPTWTEQGDLLFAVHAGHGEFPKIVLAPGDVKEMIELTTKAFNLADIYQTPVIILSDMLLSESHRSLEKKWLDDFVKRYEIDRGKLINNSKFNPAKGGTKLQIKSQNFLRYKITNDGISHRLMAGTPGYFYQANSYEHLEDGHTTEESKERLKQVNKRNKKTITYLTKHFQLPKTYGDINQAEIIFVAWGSIKGSILETQKRLLEKGKKSALIHFNHTYPLDKDKIIPLFKNGKRHILVENNSQGQFGKLLQQETGIEIKEKILNYDGRPIWPEEIVRKI